MEPIRKRKEVKGKVNHNVGEVPLRGQRIAAPPTCCDSKELFLFYLYAAGPLPFLDHSWWPAHKREREMKFLVSHFVATPYVPLATKACGAT